MPDAGNIPHFLPCNQPRTDARECVYPRKREKCFFWFEAQEIQLKKKNQKKNSPFLTPFWCLHKYKHFTNQYITERQLVQENTCLFPYWHLFSTFPNQSMEKASTLQAGLVLLFQIFSRHKNISNRLDLHVKKSLQNSNVKNKKKLLVIS